MGNIMAYWKNKNNTNGNRAFIGTVVSFKGNDGPSRTFSQKSKKNSTALSSSA